MDVQLNSLTALATHLEIVSSNARKGHGWTYDEEVKMLLQAAAELKLLRDREANTMKLCEHVEAMSLDKARLDWLMDAAQWHTPLSMVHGEVREYRFRTPCITPTIDVRKAIDAAIANPVGK